MGGYDENESAASGIILYTCSKLNRLLCVLVLALPALAQLDSGQLRVKFGAPLSREIFRIQPGFDLVVDYGASFQVCRAASPRSHAGGCCQSPEHRRHEAKDAGVSMDLVPDTMRGKSLRRMFSQSGAFSSVSPDEYEHVAIVETYSGSNDTITVRFKNAGCQQTEQTAR